MMFLDCNEAAHAGADHNADPFRVLFRHLEAGLVHSHLCSRDREMDETVHLLYLFGLNVVFGPEIMDLTGYPGRK
jgi:hypothetical protein